MLWRSARRIEPLLVRAYRRLTRAPRPNLSGDRDIEHSWVVAHMPDGPGRALDFGCGDTWLGLVAARKGFAVTALDVRPIRWPYRHAAMGFVHGDLLAVDVTPDQYDLLICCSTIEHVGLPGRYKARETGAEADLIAMKALRASAKHKGTMLLTIPVGKDRLVAPWHRVYGERRLPTLLQGWAVVKREYWVKDEDDRWVVTDEATALSVDPSDHYYALGLFVLTPAEGTGSAIGRLD